MQAGLKPTDAVVVVWEEKEECEGTQTLQMILQKYQEYIEFTTKSPVLRRTELTSMDTVITDEEQKVSRRACTCGQLLF